VRERPLVPRDWAFTLVFAAFIGAVVWFSHAIVTFLVPPANAITVPSFVGSQLTDANGELARLGLTSEVVEHMSSDRYPANTIMNQEPEGGTEVRPGRQISFVVSDGIIARSMPDLRYESMREVGLDLARMHLQLGTISYARSNDVPEGHVVSQEPDPLVNVYEGQIVNVVLSRGGDTVVRVPNLVGLTIDEARALARRDDVKLGQLVWTPLGTDGPPHGVVARQDPAPGQMVAAFDPVSLQVSAGPLESGYILRQVHVLASVPVPDQAQPGQQIRVRLVVHDATGTYTMYDAYAQPGQKLDFTVSALGSSTIDLYANNVLVGEQRLGREPPNVYHMSTAESAAPAQTP
jgi:beta-lactam-binding protein with PASTA domain